MIDEKLVRTSLWITTPFNFLAAGILAFPALPAGQLLGLSPDVDPVYRALCPFFIALFGVVYGWTAMQEEIPEPMLVLGAVGKTGVFVIASALCLTGNATPWVVALASVDMTLALIWFRYLSLSSNKL
jgi:hypothetical protein